MHERLAGVHTNILSMHPVASDHAKVGIAIVGVNGKRQRAIFAVGFLCSVVLHGLMLLPIMLMLDRATTTLVIPVDVVLAYQTADPPPPDTAFAPQKEVGATSSPAAAPLGVSPSDERPDDLELKLQRLAKLRR